MDMLFGSSDSSHVAAAAAAATSRSNAAIVGTGSSSKPPPPPSSSAVSSGQSTPVVDNTHHSSHASSMISHSNSNAGVVDHAAIADEVRRVVREEVRTTVLPVIRQTVTDCLLQSAANNNSNAAVNANASNSMTMTAQQQQNMIHKALQPLQASLDALTRQGVTVDHAQVAASVGRSVQEPLRVAFAETARTLFVPTLESVTNQVLRQVSDQLELQQQDQVNRGSAELQERDRKLESVSQQLTTMTALVAELTKEVQGLQTAVVAASQHAAARGEGGVAAGGAMAAPQQPPPPPQVPQPDPAEALRQLILQLLQERKYEEAFTKAVSTNTVEMTVFCCRSADLQDVLGGAQPALSQPILLCLMQQLGTVLAGSSSAGGGGARRNQYYDDPTRELEWLQEIALSLDPHHPAIHRHVPAVLQQVVSNINQRMAAPDNDPALRRPLQRMLQVVRGVQMG